METVQASSFEHRRPQRPDGMGRAAMFALLVHVGLLIALAFGVNWRSSEPAGASAELWAAVPQAAAPAAVEPPPAPLPLPKPLPKVETKPVEAPPPPKEENRDAEIAIEKAKAAEKEKREEQEREKLERQKSEKLEREKAEKLEREREAKLEREKVEKEKRAAAAEAESTAKVREENLKRMLGQAGATGAPQSTGTAQRDSGPSANYAGKIIARVRPNIVLTDSVPPGLRAEVEVRAAPDGTITGRRLTKSSGNPTWDDAVLRAIDRTGDLPKDDSGKVPSSIVIGFTPS
jgi:colicin import membrane protein